MRIKFLQFIVSFILLFSITASVCCFPLTFSFKVQYLINDTLQKVDCWETTNKKALSLYKDAERKFRFKAYSDAIFLLKQAIDIDDEYFQAYYLLGRIYYEKLNVIAANKYFLKSIELCPDYRLKAYFYLGNIALGNEKYDDALKYLSKYVKDVEKIETEKEYTLEDYNYALENIKQIKTRTDLLNNPVPFNPHVVEDISTKRDEYLATMSPDNEIMYFVRKVYIQDKFSPIHMDEEPKDMFMYSEKENGKFDKGESMPPPFNQHENEGGATVTLDNKTIYFALEQYNKKHTYLNGDIYTSEFKHGKWGPITPLDSNINNPDSWDVQPSVTSDGKTLYFVSDRPGGFGGYDIYVSHKDDKGHWSKAENLGPTINTKGNEKTPFIHTDSQTLYFSSNGRPGMGGYDIYYSKLKDDGTWTEPKNIGYPINTRYDDVGFFVSTDGHYGYFASNQLKGPGGWDIFSFELYKEARPENVLLIKGNIKDEKNEEPVIADVELQNIATKKISQIPVDSTTGEYSFAVLFRNDYLLTVKKEGYAFSSRYFSKEDTTFNQPKKVEIDIKPLEVGETYRINDIYFKTDSFSLTPSSKVIIDDFIKFLNDNPNMKIAIHGHTDNVGNSLHNLYLSENRAKSVYEYMISKEINPKRLSYKGFGDTKPVDTNSTEEGRAKNRRTEFVIIEK